MTLGQFKITNSLGNSATVDLTQGTFTTIGDVMRAINAKNIGVTASIDPNGNGILLTDTAGGTQKLTVAEQGSTTAGDLNILGSATATTIDGAFKKPSPSPTPTRSPPCKQKSTTSASVSPPRSSTTVPPARPTDCL